MIRWAGLKCAPVVLLGLGVVVGVTCEFAGDTGESVGAFAINAFIGFVIVAVVAVGIWLAAYRLSPGSINQLLRTTFSTSPQDPVDAAERRLAQAKVDRLLSEDEAVRTDRRAAQAGRKILGLFDSVEETDAKVARSRAIDSRKEELAAKRGYAHELRQRRPKGRQKRRHPKSRRGRSKQ